MPYLTSRHLGATPGASEGHHDTRYTKETTDPASGIHHSNNGAINEIHLPIFVHCNSCMRTNNHGLNIWALLVCRFN